MTILEQKFMETVPMALRDIANELKTLNNGKTPEIKEVLVSSETKPYWDEEHNGVFIPIINKVLNLKNLSPKEETWDKAMDLAKSVGKELPSQKEMLILSYYKDEINEILAHHDGDLLEDWYWSCLAINDTDALLISFNSNNCFGCFYKGYTGYARAVSSI